MDNINYENFKNICRICISNCGTSFTKDSVILDIFHKLTDLHFETNNELPQQICIKCFEFINEIHAFSMTCKQTHSALMKCLNDYKNIRIKEETNEEIEIYDEITIEEHKIEFVKVELNNDWEINDAVNEDINIQAENDDEEPISIINSNVLNKDSKSLDIESSKNINSLRNNKKIKCNICIGTSSSKKGHKCEHVSEDPSVPEISINMSTVHYKCDQCEKSFTKLWCLKNHKRVHSREYPYECDECGKSFTQTGNLKVHKRLHSGKRPFECDQCKKSFNQSSYLKIHKRVHSDDHPYKCDQCEKTFALSASLKYHKLVHSGARPHKCDQCEVSFIQLSNLKAHKRIHSGECPYKCDHCEKAFTHLGSLKYHKRVHCHDM